MSDGYRIDPGPVYPRAVCIMGSRWYVKTGPGFLEYLCDGDGPAQFATREDAERHIEVFYVMTRIGEGDMGEDRRYPRAARMVDGWCVKLGPGLLEWLEDADGELLRFATKEDAERQIEVLRTAIRVIVRGTVSQLIEAFELSFDGGEGGVIDEEILRLAFGGGPKQTEETDRE